MIVLTYNKGDENRL